MKWMNEESVFLQQTVTQKKDRLENVAEKVIEVVKKINQSNLENFDKISKDLRLIEGPEKLDEIKIKEQSVQLKQTPFYNYLKFMKPKIEELCPNIKHIELVAFVQQKWEKLTKEQQIEYVNADQKQKSGHVVVEKRDSHKQSSEKESDKSQDDPKSNQSQSKVSEKSRESSRQS